LGCEVSGWWDGQAAFYTEPLCRRLYDVFSRIDLVTSTPQVQKASLQIFKIVFERYPNLEGLSIVRVLPTAWDFMWHDDEQVKAVARAVVKMIADRHGGTLETYHIVKQKVPTEARLLYEVIPKIKEEMRVLPVDALVLWHTITRLVKERIIDLAQTNLKFWLMIPQVHLHTR
jgi:hypothetical protein